MVKKKSVFAVIGCGRFGYHLALTLSELGNDVLAVDSDEEVVNSLAPYVTYAYCANAGEEGALDSIGLSNVDCAVIGFSSNFEASIMATVTCREKNVPAIVAKARSEMHGRILMRVGATKIVIPEKDIGIKLAHSLSKNSVYEYINLSPDYSLIEIDVPESWVGKTIIELDIRAKFGISIIGIKHGDSMNINPTAEDVFHAGDHLLVLGLIEDIQNVEDE